MIEPQLIPTDALKKTDVAISVSDSQDLGRLGLTPDHCRLAVAEVARGILLAGGRITYGGRLRPAGFTQILMDEVRRYGDGRKSLTICVSEDQHREISQDDLKAIDKSLGTSAQLVLLDAAGQEVDLYARQLPVGPDSNPAEALTAMRRFITDRTNARVLVGGQLTNYLGSVPGIIEEAILSMAASQPVYVAGGFGGAAAAVASSLGIDDHAWGPGDFPAGIDQFAVQGALVKLAQLAEKTNVSDGLHEGERKLLAASHRPGDIATLMLLGLARTRGKVE
jgi:hypothetical protein